MSENLWVNLSSRNMLYQLSYLMLIKRSIDANLIVYVGLIVNQAEYQYEVWKGYGTRAERFEKIVYARVLSCIPMSSTLHCYVNAEKLLNKKTFKLNCRERILQCIWKVKYRASRWLKLVCSCKDEARVANYCNYKLSRDRKKIVALQHMLTLTKQ